MDSDPDLSDLNILDFSYLESINPFDGSPSAKLTTIEIENFKSFKGKRHLSVRGKLISIIGENGSGKSNCLDAICFGLGCDASALRASQLKDLIHGAYSNEHAGSRESMATVSLVFDILPKTKASEQRKSSASDRVITEKLPTSHLDNESDTLLSIRDTSVAHVDATTFTQEQELGTESQGSVRSIRLESEPVGGSDLRSDLAGPLVTENETFDTDSTQKNIPSSIDSDRDDEPTITLKAEVIETTAFDSDKSDDEIQQVDGQNDSDTDSQESRSEVSLQGVNDTHSSDFYVAASPAPQFPLQPAEEDSPNTSHILLEDRIQRRIPSTTSEQPSKQDEQTTTSEDNQTIISTPDEPKQIRFSRTVRLLTSCSEYKINNKLVTAKEYLQKIKEIGINDRANMFLVFQGRIDEIARKKPYDMTKLFELISGSIEYKNQYDVLSKKLEELSMNDQKLKASLKLFKREKLELTKDVISAKEYQKLSAECDKASALYYLFKLHLNEEMLNGLKCELKETKALLYKHKSDSKEKEKHLTDKKRDAGNVQRQLSSVEQNIRKIETELMDSKCALIKTKETVQHVSKKSITLEKLYRQAEKENINHIKNVDHLKNTLKDLQELQIQKIAACEAHDSQVFSSSQKLSEYNQLKAEATKKAGHLMLQLDSMYRDGKVLEEKLAKIRDQENMRTDDKTRIEKKISASEGRIERIQTNLAETEHQLEGKKVERSSVETTISSAKSSMEVLMKQLNELNAEIAELKVDRAECSRAEERREILQALQRTFGQDKVLGRVRKLIKINNPTFVMAVMRVFGPHQNKIVVDTETTAMDCIKYLKTHQLGVETFLPLNISNPRGKLRQHYRIIGSKFNMTVRLMYDLLTFDPKVEPAVLWITNNVLVCEQPEDAQFIAYESDKDNYKNAVSLNGTYYNKNGLIYGGDSRRLTASYNADKLETLKSKRDKVTEELRKTSKSSGQYKELDARNMSVEIVGMERRIEIYKRELNLEKINLEQLKKELNSLSSQQEDETDRKQIESAMKDLDDRILAKKREVSEVESIIFAEFCRDIGVDNILHFEENQLVHRIKHQDELQKIVDNISKVENELNYELGRNTNKVRQCKQKWESALQQQKQLDKQLAVELEKLAAVEAKLKENKELKERTEESYNELEAEIKAIRKQADEARKLVYEVNQRVPKFKTKINKLKADRHELLLRVKSNMVPITLKRGTLDCVQVTNTPSPAQDTDPQALAQFNKELEQIEVDYSLLKQIPNIMNVSVEEAQEMEDKLKKIMVEKRDKKEQHRPYHGNEDDKLRELLSKIQAKVREEKSIAKRLKKVKRNLNKIISLRTQKFNHMLDFVNQNIDATYKALTRSVGFACINLLGDDLVEPYRAGIELSCTPQGRAFVPIRHLSGGEQAMASLALLFTIWKYNPSPIILLDEVDCALDNVNVKRVANFISCVPGLTVLAASLKKKFFCYSDVVWGVTNRESMSTIMETRLFTLDVSKKKHHPSGTPIIYPTSSCISHPTKRLQPSRKQSVSKEIVQAAQTSPRSPSREQRPVHTPKKAKRSQGLDGIRAVMAAQLASSWSTCSPDEPAVSDLHPGTLDPCGVSPRPALDPYGNPIEPLRSPPCLAQTIVVEALIETDRLRDELQSREQQNITRPSAGTLATNSPEEATKLERAIRFSEYLNPDAILSYEIPSERQPQPSVQKIPASTIETLSPSDEHSTGTPSSSDNVSLTNRNI